MSELLFRPISLILNVYFMKTANKLVYGYITVYGMFLITKILDLAYVQNYMHCLSQNKSDTKLFRVYLFTVFTIKRPRALASLAPLGLLIVETVTNILLLLHTTTFFYIFNLCRIYVMYCYFQSVTCLQTILLYLSDLFLFPHSFTYTNVLFSSFFQFRFFCGVGIF